MKLKTLGVLGLNIALIAFLFLVFVLLSGCTSYHERFTYLDATGQTNHVVHVSHHTFLVWGKAAELKTETQTMEFIRTVNARDVELKTDSEAIKAIGSAGGAIAGEIIKKQTRP